MSLEKVVDQFKKNQIIIIRYWLANDHVLSILDRYKIDKEKFIKIYAVGILDYYIGVVNKTKEIGQCPVIDDLLDYLKDNKIRTDELFIICSNFKNALIRHTYDLEVNSWDLTQEITFIYEKNFASILEKYTKSIKNIEKALSRSHELTNKYIIMSRTNKKGEILEASNAFCEISGYTKEELIGKPHSIVRHPDTNPQVFKDLWDTILAGKVWQGEVKNKKKDGSFYWVYATIEPNFNEEGEIIGFDAIRQDITSKKEVEEQQHILVEQSKSAAMGEMISMIAHQWRQPLQAVSILSQKLPLTKIIEGEITDELLEQVVNDIGTQLEYMSKTIDDFRDFFKPEKEKDEILISKLIEKALDFLNYMLKIDVVKINIINENDDKVSLHVNEVVQVLINIIKNARDIMVEKNIENRVLNIKHYKNETFAIIEIEDNAGGIPSDTITRVFEPYFSTKTNKNGTGLGLYMSKTIIEQHSQGKISVSNSALGAVFKIELPLK